MAHEDAAPVSVSANLAGVRARIERAARDCGRDPASIRLVAVSKTKPPECVREAYAAGQRAFGENYAQELAVKAEALADLPELEWHFIGHLQTNKAKIAARFAHVVHTIDSAVVARELGRRAARERSVPLPVLVEVNIGGEAQKAGAAPSEIDEVVEAINAQPSLLLRGLMTVAPMGDRAQSQRVFDTLVTLRNLHGGAAVMPELSMGMSGDLEIAIGSGATLVRVGTDIFGPRP
jgi:pyridoxal phosphate enzyme (YggS family)